ncbi:acyl-CoA thioesterase [Sphingomonas jinjuensis]|uniref:Acyl-CoA thioesterase n=1 Tax=Sphingomonas jinjuensis TaxID=535907 RepID=A0A840FB72_9SPHN|nr:thioesterase family protein [Sphingomonas jinjuensis]MBB4155270.1 acyl-CoA thioesterase [Sphingomonas jinjuensis]
MTTLTSIIDALEPIGEDAWRGHIPDNWLQGRTAYGGLSSALALHAAQHSDADLPPLRSALVAFIGPLSGAVTITATRLRRGRNAAFVQADVTSDAGLGLRATFVFMGAVPSMLDHATGERPDFPRPGPDDRTYRGTAQVPFTQNFELVDKRDGGDPAEWLRWVRLADRDGLDPMVELIAVADCLPPAALKLVGRPVPLSSMTWQLNLLGPAPRTEDGWWLLRARTDYAREGSSSQSMAIWNAAGEPVAEQMQSVAIFG